MKRSWFFIVLSLFVALLPAGCGEQAQPTQDGKIAPTFVNVQAPAMRMDLTPFEQAGCKLDPEGRLRCPPNLPPFDTFGCFEIVEAPPLLGGLTPRGAMMRCIREQVADAPLDKDDYFYNQGCLVGNYVRYLDFQDGQLRLIKNLADLKARFAPVESSQEALSYAVAATGFEALFGLRNEQMRYLAPRIEDSQVRIEGGEYLVSLYSFATCGCGPHAMSLRVVVVKPTGEIAINDPQPVWEDPAQDGLCVD